MIYVLDACALLAHFRRETGYTVVRDLLFDYAGMISLHSLNACEVYYDSIRTRGIEEAEGVIRDIVLAGIEIREDQDPAIWKFAGQLKAEYKRLSLADCFALGLAKRLDATLVTSDHGEFDKMVEKNVCSILFIR